MNLLPSLPPRTSILALALPALMSLAACTGGGGGGAPDPAPPVVVPSAATRLAYTDPVDVPPEAWCLVRNAKLSTPGSHLVLELRGPAAGVSASGVVLTLQVDAPKAGWGTPALSQGSALSGDAVYLEQRSGSRSGTLQALAADRGPGAARLLGNGILLRVSLDLGRDVEAGSLLALAVVPEQCKALLGNTAPDTGLPVPIDVRVGALRAQ